MTPRRVPRWSPEAVAIVRAVQAPLYGVTRVPGHEHHVRTLHLVARGPWHLRMVCCACGGEIHLGDWLIQVETFAGIGEHAGRTVRYLHESADGCAATATTTTGTAA